MNRKNKSNNIYIVIIHICIVLQKLKKRESSILLNFTISKLITTFFKCSFCFNVPETKYKTRFEFAYSALFKAYNSVKGLV